MKVDFIAYHKLQAQAAESVFERLSLTHDCRWLMGPFNSEKPGDVGLLIDHRCFHDIHKSRSGYKYLFHLSHDIADTDVYRNENLQDFDIIFVPTVAHYNVCLELGYEAKRIKIAGWPKYDGIDSPLIGNKEFLTSNKLENMSILYAPTFASNYEWKKLFPFFMGLGCQVIIKNHIYVDEGQPTPPGQEAEYLSALESVQEMEAKALELGFLVVSRSENICNIFKHADILLSDSSSCLVEFLPFGVSIETGGGPFPSLLGYKPEASLLSNDIWLCPVEKLIRINPTSFFELVKVFSERRENAIVRFQSGYSAGFEISAQIADYLSKYKPRYSTLKETSISFLRRIKQKLVSC